MAGESVAVDASGRWETSLDLPATETHQIVVEVIDGEGRSAVRTLVIEEGDSAASN